MKDVITFSLLVVDDDEDDRMIIDEAFREIGYEAQVKKFVNGKALLQYLDSIEPLLYPSLIVLDNTLPVLSAADILSALKQNASYKDIPVVVYTSALSESKKEQLLTLGASACYVKGSTMPEVVELAKDLKAKAEAKTKNA